MIPKRDDSDVISKTTLLSVLGFDVVLDEPFTHRDKTSRKEVTDRLLVMAHRDGFVSIDQTWTRVHEDGHHEVQFAGPSLYYNWQPASLENYIDIVSSGGWVQDPEKINQEKEYFDSLRANQIPYDRDEWNRCIETRTIPFTWSGYHSLCHDIFKTITRLKENGVVLEKWIECPINWIATSEEKSDKSSTKTWREVVANATATRFKQLPEWVQEMIGSIDCLTGEKP